MRYSPESLLAFTEAAALGSFSAAARKLNRSQSTISISIANLEADIGCQLFDRGGRQPVLNNAGEQVLQKVKAILNASEGLEALAAELSKNIESVLSIVVSDVYNPFFQTDLLLRFEQKFPYTEFQCGPAEGADVINLVQEGHANIGVLISQHKYPADVSVSNLGNLREMGVYVSHAHPLASLEKVTREALTHVRHLVLKTYSPGSSNAKAQTWSAPDHLMLLEFALQGFGWAELPRHLVERFGNNGLVELDVPGYSKQVEVDIVWRRQPALGPAGQWFVRELHELKQ